jgi:putative DNA primase/helicase
MSSQVESQPRAIPAELQFLIAQGLREFPVKTGTKDQPLVKDWGNRASADEKVIADWYARFPDSNWAVVPPNDIIILDYDGAEGLGLLAEHEKKHGPLKTLSVASGGGHGGVHLYFRAEGHRLTNGPSALSGLDTKTSKGYVIAPPSIVAQRYRFLDQSPIAEIPPGLLLALIDGKPSRHRTAPHLGDVIHEGSRDNTLTSLAGTMRRRGATEEAILAALRVENKKCVPSLTDADLQKIARSVARYEPNVTDLILHRTDLGNARLFADQHREIIRYSQGLGYLLYDGARWRPGPEDVWMPSARETIRGIFELGIKNTDNDQHEKLIKHALASERRERLRAMLSLARSEPGIMADDALFNRDGFLLSVANGTLELRRDVFRLREHRSCDLITRIAPVAYDPAAPCPRWRQFIERILPEPAKRDFLQRAVGYALTGDVSEQCFFILWGEGANGKTTFLNVVLRLLGDYALKANFDAFLRKTFAGIPNDVARLAGARLVVATEGPEGKHLNEGLVKELTGGDQITARFLHREFFTFDFVGKIFLGTNYRPRIDDPSHAMWRRIKLIEFGVEIPEGEQDHGLSEKLLGELSGILNWALDGCLAWQEHGLEAPEEVRQAVLEYRSESDVIADFLADCCVVSEGAFVTAKRLHEAYVRWARESEQRFTLSKIDFNARLRARFATSKPKNVLTWRGVGLRASEGEDS